MSKVLVMVGIVAGLSIVSISDQLIGSVDGAGLCLVVLLPMIVRTSGPPPDAGASRQVVIITPHNEQIRTEFADAFERWHLATYDEPVEVVWNVPGGTSEIRRMLGSLAPLPRRAPGGDADLVFGGSTSTVN